jgi:hypothetical protein
MSELSSAREAEKRWRYNYVEFQLWSVKIAGNDMSAEAEESPLLRSVIRKRLVKAD